MAEDVAAVDFAAVDFAAVDFAAVDFAAVDVVAALFPVVFAAEVFAGVVFAGADFAEDAALRTPFGAVAPADVALERPATEPGAFTGSMTTSPVAAAFSAAFFAGVRAAVDFFLDAAGRVEAPAFAGASGASASSLRSSEEAVTVLRYQGTPGGLARVADSVENGRVRASATLSVGCGLDHEMATASTPALCSQGLSLA